MVGGHVGRPIVLRPVDQLRRQRGQHLPVRQHHRLRAERLHHPDHQIGLLHPDLQALEIRQAADRLRAGIDRARPGIVIGQPDETVGLDRRQDVVADRAIDHLVEMVDRAEQERLRKDAQGRRIVPDRRHIDAIEVDGADASLRDGLAFLAELPGMENPDAVTPLGSFRHQFVHVKQGLDGGIALLLDVGGPKLPGGRPVKRSREPKPRQGSAAPHRQISGQNPHIAHTQPGAPVRAPAGRPS